VSNWIPISERMPTREDADERGEVVWLWGDGAAMVARWGEGWCDPQPVAWMPIPPYTRPKPGPTDAECEILHAGMAEAVVDGERTEPIIRHWFVDVTARIETEKRGAQP